MRVMNDGFVYKLVNYDIAKDIFSLGLFELYVLHDDDTESLIDSRNDLNNALESGSNIGIAVGNINQTNQQ